MMHLPRTIKAALLSGLLVIFAVWLASTSYITARLADAQERSAALHDRYLRGQELLYAVRSQVLLGSIYVRDALIETSQGQAGTGDAAAGQLRSLQAAVNQELEQYKAIDSLDEGAAWARLENELRDYWKTTDADIVPKRAVIEEL